MLKSLLPVNYTKDQYLGSDMAGFQSYIPDWTDSYRYDKYYLLQHCIVPQLDLIMLQFIILIFATAHLPRALLNDHVRVSQGGDQ